MRKLFITILLIYCNILIAQQNQPYDSITNFIQSYQYKSAIELVNTNLDKGSDAARLYHLKGLSYKGLLKYAEAAYAFENAISKDSSNYQTYQEAAFCYKLLGNYSRAIRNFQKANRLNPDVVSNTIEIAGIFVSMEEYAKALDIYLGLYRKDTVNIFLIRSTGKAYENLEMTDSARFFYEKAVQLNPFDFQSVIRLCNIDIKLRKYPQAIFITDNYKRFDPLNSKINRLNAYAYYLSDDFVKAIQSFKACIKSCDTTDFTFKYLGLAYFRTETYDSAKIFLEKSFRKDSLNPQTCYALGIACTMSKFKDEGILYLNKTLELITPSPRFESEVWQHLADAHNKCAQYRKGLQAFLSAYRVTPNDTLLKFRLAVQYDENLKNKKLALKYYAEFMKTRPSGRNDGQPKKSKGLSYYDAVEKRMNQLKQE